MKKILCFIDCLGAGGAQRQFVGLASMLNEQGYQVKVITYYDIPFYKNVLDENNIECECVENAQKPLPRILNIHKAITKYNPDCLISFLDTPCILSCIDKLVYNKKYKLIVSERNTTQKITFKEKLKFWFYKCADIIVPNAYAQRNFIIENFPNLKDKVKVIHNFVDLKHFSLKHNIKRNTVPIVVTVASIWGSKNTLGFIEAVKLLKERGIKCEFHWYGKVDFATEYLAKCESKIKAYGLEDYMILHDKTKKIKDVYHTADYFCLPSFYEGTPNVICEAMSCGLPIVCSDVCDNSRYVQEGKNGFLFNPKETNEIVSKLEQILKISEDQYYQMSTNSRSIAEDMFSSECFFQKYLNLI